MSAIFVVGIGPSGGEYMTKRAFEVLDMVDVVVGYRGYLDRISDVILGKECVSYSMGGEVKRALHAVQRARKGERVAIVSGGDAGVYGMASLVLEVVPADVDVEIVPGVTSGIAAASRLGAPISLDFAVVSLSDILVPWSVIRHRVMCLAKSGMTTVIYNPASKSRRWQLLEAFRVFVDVRGSFYVGVVRKAFMKGETVFVFKSDESPKGWFDEVDMLSIVFFCDSKCFLKGNRLILPRGYKL